MRRSEREVKDLTKIESFIKNCNVMHVGFYDGVKPYIFPVNFGYDFLEGKLNLFFHGATSGQKAELSKCNPIVAFEMENDNGVIGKGNEACKYSCNYNSVMGNGRIYIIEDLDEKSFALNKIMKNITQEENFSYNNDMVKRTNVYKIEAIDFTAKEKG